MFSNPDIFWKELALTLRSLRRERAFTTLSVLLLALGIGFASAVFTLLWQAVETQLPVPNPEQIFAFETNVTHNGRSESDAMAQTFSVPMYRYLAGHLSAGSQTVARHGEMVNLETPSGSRHLLADFVTGNFFDVLEVRAAIGRTIGQRDDDTSSSARFVAVLSYDFWQEAYGGQASAWNSGVRVNGIPFSVIGVALPGFRGPISGQAPKLYLPVAVFGDINPGWRGSDDWALRWLNAFVRLPRHVSTATAEGELQPVYRAAVRQELASQGTQSADYLKELSHERMSLVPASQGVHAMLDEWREPLRVLQWMTLAVLSLAAINVAGLMVIRAVKQKQEMLIRYAVGTTRTAVMRLHFLQTLVLSIAGGALGLWIARWVRSFWYISPIRTGTAALSSFGRMDGCSGFTSRVRS